MVGLSGYGTMSDRPGAIEIAAWIGEAHWGRGYATEATHAVIDRAFCDPGSRSCGARTGSATAAPGG